MNTIISKSNIDAATAAEIQKYLDDKGITELRMRKTKAGWYYDATFTDRSVLAGGPYPEMSDCMQDLIKLLDEN